MATPFLPRALATVTRTLVGRVLSAVALAALLSGTADAVDLRQRVDSGAVHPNPNPWNSTANVAVCPPAPASEFQGYRYVPGILQGYYHFDWTLYRDGHQVGYFEQTWDLRGNAMAQNYTFQNTFFAVPTNAGSYTVLLEARKRAFSWGGYNYNNLVFSEWSSPIVVSNVAPVPSFKILNSDSVFVTPPADGSPIQVSLTRGITMDASATNCSTGYDIIVQESNASWLRPAQHEWSKWFVGPTPSNLNLDFLTNTYSATDGTGYFSLAGGIFTATSPSAFVGQARYYRIGLNASGPWNPKFALIQVNR